MLNHNDVNGILQRHDIPKATVAICACVDSAAVTNFTKGAKVSSAVSMAIGRAVEDIVSVIERAKPIRPDVSNGQYMKDLIRRWRETGCFVVMTEEDPTRYFSSVRDGKLYTTLFLLQATALSKDLADQIAAKRHLDGKYAVVLHNPYSSIEQRFDEMSEIWKEAVTA